jgi:hypothetical protein
VRGDWENKRERDEVRGATASEELSEKDERGVKDEKRYFGIKRARVWWR